MVTVIGEVCIKCMYIHRLKKIHYSWSVFTMWARQSFTEILSKLYNSCKEGVFLLNKGKTKICFFQGIIFEASNFDAVSGA